MSKLMGQEVEVHSLSNNAPKNARSPDSQQNGPGLAILLRPDAAAEQHPSMVRARQD